MSDEGYQWGQSGPVKYGAVLPVSDGLIRRTADLGGIVADALMADMRRTPEEREQRRQEAAQARAAEREAAEHVPLTFDTLMAKLGWSREYAEHFVQRYCTCGDGFDGWEHCRHVEDLGID